jgi:hypothetical protein
MKTIKIYEDINNRGTNEKINFKHHFGEWS